MKTLQLNIPETLEIKDYDLYMIIASKLYSDGILTAGQAADIVGISKKSFIEVLGKYNTSIFSSYISDYHSDLTNA